MCTALAGCAEPGGHIHGTWGYPYVPTDGERRAEYVSHDEAVPWRLVVEKTAAVEVDGVEHATFTWSRDDTGDTLGTLTWASSDRDGARVFAWTDADGNKEIFDPPVVFVDSIVRIGDAFDTATGGRLFRSTYAGIEDCPVAWGLDWEDCVHVSLAASPRDGEALPIFVGDYWLVQRYGPAWMLPAGYAEKWDLADYEWSEDH